MGVIDGREWFETTVGDHAGFALGPSVRGHTTIDGAASRKEAASLGRNVRAEQPAQSRGSAGMYRCPGVLALFCVAMTAMLRKLRV